MASITLTSPENGETGVGIVNELTEKMSITGKFDITGSEEPWGIGDCSQYIYYLDGVYVGFSGGWKSSGSYAVSLGSVDYYTTHSWYVKIFVHTDAMGGGGYVFSPTWSFTAGGPPANVRSVHLDPVGVTLVAAAEDGIYLSFDSGDNWAKKRPDGVAETDWVKAICSISGIYLIAVSSANAIYRSANTGTGWTAITPAGGDTFSVNKVAMSDNGKYVVIVGENSTDETESCYISTDYGVTWTAKNPTNVSVIWTDCSISNDGTIIAVSCSGFFEMSFDSGTTWKGQTVPATTENWGGLSLSGDGSFGLIANLSDNDEFFVGVKTLTHSEETWAEADFTSAGRALLDDADAAAQATTLGLGTTDSPEFAGLTLTGNMVIPDDGYVGSDSEPTAMQIASTGVVTFEDEIDLGTHRVNCGSINRADGGTLLLQIGLVTKFSLSATTATFAGNIVIPSAGYIGSAGDPNAIQIAASGEVSFTDVATGILPTAGAHLATKEYVDLAIGASADFFLSDNDDAVIADYHILYETDTGEASSTLVTDPMVENDDQLMFSYITASGVPGVEFLRAGVYILHSHLSRGTGDKPTTFYWTLSKYTIGDVETVLLTSEESSTIPDSTISFITHATLAADTAILDTDRLVLKLYANVGAAGGNSEVTIYMEGTHDCHLTNQLPSSIWQNQGDVLDDLNITGVNTFTGDPVNDFLVGTAAGTLVWQYGATARTSMGVAIGTNVQAWDAGLDSLAGLTYAAASFVKMTGANTFVLRTIGDTADDLQGTIDHDLTANYVADKHVAHAGVSITAGKGLSGGGTIATTRDIALDLTEMTGNVVWDDGATDASITWTYALSGANDPVWTIGANSMDLTTGVLKVGGTTVMLVGGAPTAHLHDGDTLECDGINSSAGAFAFTTAGIVTFSNAVTMGVGMDLTIAGHILFNTDGSSIGFTHANIAFDDTADTVTATGGFIGLSTAAFEGASVTVGKASTTTGTIVLHDSGSANTITLTVPNALAGSLSFTLPPTDGADTNVLQTNGSGVLTWVAAGGTSHADVLVDGDFASAGLMNTDGSGGYSIKAIGTDVQAYHANLAAIAAGTWTGANSITTLGTISTVGNITIAGNGTIGQAAGPLLTFDDTNNFLEITGCYVGNVAIPLAALHFESSSYPVGKFVRTTTGTASIYSGYQLLTRTSANMADAFGGGIILSIEDEDSGEQAVARIYAQRDGADNEGKLSLRAGTDGNEQFFTIAADGGIHVTGLKSGTDQADAGAAANELYHDTDDHTIKIGV